MLDQSKAVFTAAVILCVVFVDSNVNAFQVYSNSRSRAAANGRPSSRSFSSSSRSGRSNTYRRSTSSFGAVNRSPVFRNYTPGTLNRPGTSTYHANPNRTQRRSGVASYSSPYYDSPYVSGYSGISLRGGFGRLSYGSRLGGLRYGGYQYGRSGFFVNPYVGSSIYHSGFGPSGYAPSVVAPYSNPGFNVNIGVNPGQNPGVVEQAPAPGQLLQPGFPGQAGDQTPGQDFATSIAIDELPIVNEFPVSGAPTDTVESSTVNRIQSIRYQASADAFYRDSDFASAAALYRKAAEEAADRQAPWLRLAFTQVQLNQNAEAVKSLKAALNRNDEPTAAWVSAKSLAGPSGLQRSSLSEGQLFNWLKQRPNSTDRLLLTAAWSEFQGSSSAARELIELAKNAGLSNTIASNLKTVIQDSHKKDRPKQLADQVQPAAATTSELESFSDADILLLPGADRGPRHFEAEHEPIAPLPDLVPAPVPNLAPIPLPVPASVPVQPPVPDVSQETLPLGLRIPNELE